MQRRLTTAFLIAAVLLLLVPLVTLGGGWSTLLGRTVQDLGHLPLFGCVATLLLLVVSRWNRTVAAPARQYALVFALSLALGVVTETVQMFGKRDADAMDLLRNGIGTLIALAWWSTFDRRFDGRRPRHRAMRILLRFAAVMILLVSLYPLADVANAYVQRSRRLPQLYSYDTDTQARFIATRLAWYEFGAAPDAWVDAPPAHVAHIRFSHLIGGAIVFNEPYPDWSAYSVLILELFHAGAGRIEMGLRIDDRSRSRERSDRYNRHLTLQPGVNRFRIPLDEVLRGPAERELDLEHIERIVLFPVDPRGGYELFLAPIRLEALQMVRAAR